MSFLNGLRRILVLTLPLLAASAMFAQVKVGIVDTQGALSETAEMKKAQTDLEVKFKARNEEFQQLQKEYQDLQSKLSLGDKLTAQAQNELTLQAQRKQRDLQRLGEDLQAAVDRERNEIIARTSQRLKQVLDKIAADKSLDVIIDAADTVFFNPALDITKEATAAYDKAYPAK